MYNVSSDTGATVSLGIIWAAFFSRWQRHRCAQGGAGCGAWDELPAHILAV